MKRKMELHAHTAEISPCSRLSAEELVRQHKQAGYGGIVITDHFNACALERLPGTDEEKARGYLKGYERALAEGNRIGIRVLFGVEVTLEDGMDDFLIYGATPELVLRNPRLHQMTQKELYAVCRRWGALLIQAHPFRAYCKPRDPRYLDGIEIYNGNGRHDSRNDLAKRWAAAHPEWIGTSGSDTHMTLDVGRGGMLLPPVQNERQLPSALREGVLLQTPEPVAAMQRKGA